MVEFLLLNGAFESNFGRENFERGGDLWFLGRAWSFAITLGHGEKGEDGKEERKQRCREKEGERESEKREERKRGGGEMKNLIV